MRPGQPVTIHGLITRVTDFKGYGLQKSETRPILKAHQPFQSDPDGRKRANSKSRCAARWPSGEVNWSLLHAVCFVIEKTEMPQGGRSRYNPRACKSSPHRS